MRDFIPFAQPFFGKEEKKEMLETLDSGWATLGPRTKQFEEQFAHYVGAKYAIGVTSCTAAIHLSLVASGIGPGDEVIVPIFTFTATSNPIIHVGAKPIFVDIEPDTFNIDVEKIEEKITKKTKAIIPVHYGGQPVNLAKIKAIAKKHNLTVIEDAAHAIGTTYKGKMIGSHSEYVCFSFHPIKNISTGDGGMITTNSSRIADHLSQLRLHGMSKDAWKRHSAAGSWKYDITEPGFKYNMFDIQAALGIQQLKKHEKFLKTRKEYAHIYDKAFSKTPEIIIPYIQKGIRHAYNLYTIQVETKKLSIDRDKIVDELKKKGIGVSVYFIPLHYFTFYKKMGYKKGDFPIAESVFEKIISLPLYPKMTKEELNYISKTLINLIEENRKL
jgi:dTDP-4-amino-4,6-dideoxygalactose transaminase